MALQLNSVVNNPVTARFKENDSARLDFAYGNFVSEYDFFSEYSRLQEAFSEDENEFVLPSGQTMDLQTTGGFLGLQQYLETRNSAHTTLVGVGKRGLKAQNKLLSSMR